MEELADISTFRSYLFFWGGQLFSLMGSLVVQFVITWWVTITTGNATFLSLGSFLYFLPMVVVTPIAGVLTDKWNRKKLIGIVDSLQALVTIWIIILFYFKLADPLFVILVNSLRGLCQAFHLPTVSAIVPTMVPKDRLSRINGVNYLFTSLIQIIGPVIAATFLIFFPIEVILWLDVITYVIAITPLLLIKIPSVNGVIGKEEKIPFKIQFREGLIAIKLVPGLITIILLSMMLNFLVTPLSVLVPLYVKEIHSGGSTQYAFVMASINAGMVGGALITSIKKNWKHKMFVYFFGLMLLMGSLSALGLIPSGFFIHLGVLLFISGLILPIVNTIYMTIIQITVPADKMGRVSSVDQSLSMAINPIGTLMSGPLAEILGIRTLFLNLGLIGVLITFLTWRFTKVRSINYDDQYELALITEKINNINLR